MVAVGRDRAHPSLPAPLVPEAMVVQVEVRHILSDVRPDRSCPEGGVDERDSEDDNKEGDRVNRLFESRRGGVHPVIRR
jgi:hypothetical protein